LNSGVYSRRGRRFAFSVVSMMDILSDAERLVVDVRQTVLTPTIRKRKEGILAAVRLKINNGQHEGLNRRVRLIVNRAYGFHSANAALGLIMLTLGPINHVLPHERVPELDP